MTPPLDPTPGGHRPVDFIGIGAQKAGTTWLHARLSQVPGVRMPFIKEIHYFDRDRRYSSPNDLAESSLFRRLSDRNWRRNMKQDVLRAFRDKDRDRLAWYAKYYFGHYSDAWYLELMGMRGNITGEITPAYSMLEEVDVIRMRRMLPDAKIIYLLRNPIDRAWSHYRYDASRAGSSPDLDPGRIMDFMTHSNQTARGDYIRTIDVYEKHLGAENILIGFYDAISEQPNDLLSSVIDLIGAKQPPPASRTSLAERINESPMIPMPAKVREGLQEMYLPTMQALASRFGGYCSRWLAAWSGNASDAGMSAALPPSCLVLDHKAQPDNWPAQRSL